LKCKSRGRRNRKQKERNAWRKLEVLEPVRNVRKGLTIKAMLGFNEKGISQSFFTSSRL
ncbi:hypothetical protein SUGI_0934480, partial [Cryptomeria japonica]